MAGDAHGPTEGTTPGATAPQTLVLDASAVLSGKPIPQGTRVLVPSAVLGEVEKQGRDRRALEYHLGAGLSVRDPRPESRRRVEEAAGRTGDARRLSHVDMEVLALALDARAAVVTDDYSIQNVAVVLGLTFVPVAQRGIREVFTWAIRCTGCRKSFERDVPECDVCGSPVKTVRARR